MPRRARWAVLAVLVAALGVAVVVAGRPGELLPVTGVQRLGPEAGEPVADYLRRAPAALPGQGAGSVWGLVAPGRFLTPGGAAELAQGGRLAPGGVRGPPP